MSLQHLLFEYLEKHNFLKIVDVNSIFADVKSIVQLSRQHWTKEQGNMGTKWLSITEPYVLILLKDTETVLKLDLISQHFPQCKMSYCD